MPKKKKVKRKSKRLPPLSFDSTGSAEAIFVGLPVEIGVHWADCGLRQHHLVCPDRIGLDGKSCKFCASNVEELDDYLEDIVAPGAPVAMKGLALCWDTVREKWSFLMTYYDFFRELMRGMEAGGGMDEFQSGQGPRFVLQRVGRRMEVVTTDLWGELNEIDNVPVAPSMNDVLVHLERQSAWVKYSTVEEVVEAHPKPERSSPGIDSLKMMGNSPHFSFKGYQGPPPIGQLPVAQEKEEDEEDDITYEDSSRRKDRWDDVQ